MPAYSSIKFAPFGRWMPNSTVPRISDVLRTTTWGARRARIAPLILNGDRAMNTQLLKQASVLDVDAIRELMAAPDEPKRPISFVHTEEKPKSAKARAK